jgi:two-component system KDP operon response regulator KdpE
MGSASYPSFQNFTSEKSTRAEGKVLIMGTEAPSPRVLHTDLYSLGFDIGETATWEQALVLCRIVHYDALLLDFDIAGTKGMETFAELRRVLPRGAILVLSADNDQERKVEVLEAGADDYLTKPFHMGELTARIRAAVRRSLRTTTQEKLIVTIGDLSLDPARYLVHKAGRRIHLTPREFDLLRCLMLQPGIPVTHGRLLHILWGDVYASQIECLRTFVRQLRKKIEDDPGAPRYILTECGIGYRFVDPEDWLKNQIRAAYPDSPRNASDDGGRSHESSGINTNC